MCISFYILFVEFACQLAKCSYFDLPFFSWKWDQETIFPLVRSIGELLYWIFLVFFCCKNNSWQCFCIAIFRVLSPNFAWEPMSLNFLGILLHWRVRCENQWTLFVTLKGLKFCKIVVLSEGFGSSPIDGLWSPVLLVHVSALRVLSYAMDEIWSCRCWN